MKTITFFNEKGGVGKSTLSTMFASWLHYHEKEPVSIFDFDSPNYRLYNDFVAEKAKFGSMDDPVLTRFVIKEDMKPYNVFRIKSKDFYTQEEFRGLTEAFIGQKKSADGYVVCDFPGRFTKNDPTYNLIMAGYIDLIVFVVDSDNNSAESVCAVKKAIDESGRRRGRQAMVTLWNKETQADRTNIRAGRRDWYVVNQAMLESRGIPEIPQRLHEVEVMKRDSESSRFVKSFLCWPELNINNAFGGSKDRKAYIYDIFEDVRRRLDSVPEE